MSLSSTVSLPAIDLSELRQLRQRQRPIAVRRLLRLDELTRPTNAPHLPLVIEAGGEGLLPELWGVIDRERGSIRRAVRQHGAVLLRGWQVEQPAQFEEILQRLGYRLEREYMMGTSPRKLLAEFAFSSTEASPEFPILAHNEMAYLNTRPGMLAFYAHTAPEVDGETPLFDSRGALRSLDPEVRARLEEKGVLYRRVLPRRRGWLSNAIHRTWPEAFGSDDEAEVEKIAAEFGVELEWQGETLVTTVRVDPVVTHPRTGEESLHLQLYHLTNLLLDADNLRQRQSWWTNTWLKTRMRLLFGLGSFPITIHYGDGSEIPAADVAAMRRAIWEHSLLFAWQPGDLVILDNLNAAHGRMNVIGPRKIMAAFGDMVELPRP